MAVTRAAVGLLAVYLTANHLAVMGMAVFCDDLWASAQSLREGRGEVVAVLWEAVSWGRLPA